jgi:CHAT domain-containing protein
MGQTEPSYRLWMQYHPAFLNPEAPDEVKLTYASLATGPVVWIAKGSAVRSVHLPVRNPSLAEEVLRFASLLSDSTSKIEEIRSLGRGLYDQLVAPVAPLLGAASTLDISSDGVFASIPFGALVDPKSDWLADRFAIVYSPPLTGVSPRPTQNRAPDHLLGVSSGLAAEVLEHKFTAIPEADRDPAEAATAFRSRALLTDRDATISATLRELRSATVLHFSGHAIVTGNDAALVLAPGEGANENDRLLWASRLPAQALANVRLVVLAACSTGTSQQQDDDPSAVMARAFLKAGVPEVIASRWDVDSVATSLLVREFYAALRGGGPAASSIRAASSKLRHDASFAHPYYWAAFEMYHL